MSFQMTTQGQVLHYAVAGGIEHLSKYKGLEAKTFNEVFEYC
jgi:hypothetical protein